MSYGALALSLIREKTPVSWHRFQSTKYAYWCGSRPAAGVQYYGSVPKLIDNDSDSDGQHSEVNTVFNGQARLSSSTHRALYRCGISYSNFVFLSTTVSS